MNNPAEIAILILMAWAVIATYWALRFNKDAKDYSEALIVANGKLERLADLQTSVVRNMEVMAKDLITTGRVQMPIASCGRKIRPNEPPPLVLDFANWNPKEGAQAEYVKADYEAAKKANKQSAESKTEQLIKKSYQKMYADLEKGK